MKPSEYRPGLKKKVVSVPVATVWTTPESPRAIDMNVLQNKADMRAWVSSLTPDERLDLCTSNRTQTQVLYAEEVVVIEVRNGWANIRIPNQATRKDPLGYPGWVPYIQLTEWSRDIVRDSGVRLNAQVQIHSYAQKSAQEQMNTVVEVNAPVQNQEKVNTHVHDHVHDRGTDYIHAQTHENRLIQVHAKFAKMALLSEDAEAPYLELSYLTKLPLIEVRDTEVYVHSPHGVGVLSMKDVTFLDHHAGTGLDIGSRIAAEANTFLNLAYLWGGLSSYGYDCSGFAYSMYASQGITIPRDASDQALAGTEAVSNRLRPGDLLFFAYEEGKGRIHHVGIYIGEGKMIHSPDSKSCIEVVELTSYKLIKEHCASRRYDDSLNHFIQ